MSIRLLSILIAFSLLSIFAIILFNYLIRRNIEYIVENPSVRDIVTNNPIANRVVTAELVEIVPENAIIIVINNETTKDED